MHLMAKLKEKINRISTIHTVAKLGETSRLFLQTFCWYKRNRIPLTCSDSWLIRFALVINISKVFLPRIAGNSTFCNQMFENPTAHSNQAASGIERNGKKNGTMSLNSHTCYQNTSISDVDDTEGKQSAEENLHKSTFESILDYIFSFFSLCFCCYHSRKKSIFSVFFHLWRCGRKEKVGKKWKSEMRKTKKFKEGFPMRSTSITTSAGTGCVCMYISCTVSIRSHSQAYKNV